MIKPDCIHNKKIAIFMQDTTNADGDWVILVGTAKWRTGHLFVFREMDIPEFPVPDEALEEIEAVSEDIQNILRESSLELADFYTVVNLVPLPENVDPATLLYTGINLREIQDDK